MYVWMYCYESAAVAKSLFKVTLLTDFLSQALTMTVTEFCEQKLYKKQKTEQMLTILSNTW